MAQYCRYCNALIVGDGAYCETFEKFISESSAKATNHCKEFEFNPMDAFAENPNGYRPRAKHENYEYCGDLFKEDEG